MYWKASGRKYFNKLEALSNAKDKLVENVDFICHPEDYGSINWEVEPTQSWDDMLLVRAKQLRDEYKYLRLWYSGGSDSHTVLDTFVRNNIYIDEICVWRTSPSDQFDGYGNQEANKIAIPYLQTIKSLMPNTKINVIDIGAKEYLAFYGRDGWHRETTHIEMGPDNLYNLYEFFPQTLTQPYGYCDIQGGDKPKITRRDDVYYARLTDSQFELNLGFAHLEDFFTTPKYPELHAKQCHLLKKVLSEKYPDQDITGQLYNPKLYEPNGTFILDWYGCCRVLFKQEFSLGKDWTIYNLKAVEHIDHAKQSNPDVLKNYFGTLNEELRTNKHWFNDGDISNRCIGILSEEYCLGV